MAQRKGLAPIVLGASGASRKALTPLIAVASNTVRVEVAREHTAGISFWGKVDAACRREDAPNKRLVISVRVAKL